MLRRLAIALLVLLGWLHAVASHAQASEIARSGAVWPVGFSEMPTEALSERLRQLGWEEGRNLIVERRSAEGRIERLPSLMADVLSLGATLAQARRNAQGLIVVADPLTFQLREEISSLALRHRLPMMAPMVEFAEAGALMSYGVDNTALMRRVAEYIDRILKGTKPADIPIEQATQLTLTVNLKTAGALGITMPRAVL